ncbi:Hypothetical predicted protein [Paramuricea clavata]|uniref:Uncharacterized protein n=1 Tax=Paramuricea clavata TaxID=317549 RepID=A0A6S7HLI2_PARCT|nr:Hypothetical predicted protein [Paramuricea clavata]
MHIFKRHLGADGISREGAGSKRSERVEESSHKVRQQNRNRKQIPLVYSEGGSYEVAEQGSENPNKDKGNGKVKNPNHPNEINVNTLGTETSEKSGSNKVRNEPEKESSNRPENGESTQPGNGESTQPGNGESTQPGNGESTQPANGGSSEGGNQEELEPLPSFEKFQSGEVSDEKSYKINDDCNATVKNIEKLYQIGASPPDCINLKMLLEKVLPKDKTNFESTTFMALEHIIIRSVSLNTATKGVEIAAAYTGTATLIKDILTVSNIRVELSFVWTRSQKFTFDLAATFSIGSAPIDMRLIRNDKGYYFTADAKDNLTAATISRMFKREVSFLPAHCLQSDLKKANFDKFVLIKPRLRATFADGYGFLFGGSIRILDWDPFEVNVLFNKPNDLPTTVTIAVYTKSFSISKLLEDLFEIDISEIPVLGSVEVRNLAFSLSTGDVYTPVRVLDIGSEYIFDIPYRKGLKVSFEIPIAEMYVATSIFISQTLITLTIPQSGELNLGHVIREFLPNSNLIVTTGSETKLKNWPPFIPDPLSIALEYFHLEATKPTGSWALTKMNMELKMADVLSLFDNKININNLELDLNYVKGKDTSSTKGVILGRVALGPETSQSPRVDVRIPFPFKNNEISFTFTDFNVKSVVEALAGPNVFPKDFPELFEHIELDKIALAFDDKGSVKTVSVDASIPGLWRIFGQFSIGNVGIHFEYGKKTSSGGDGDGTDTGTDGDGTGGDGASGDGTGGDAVRISDSLNTNLLHTGESTTQSTWRLVVRGQLSLQHAQLR